MVPLTLDTGAGHPLVQPVSADCDLSHNGVIMVMSGVIVTWCHVGSAGAAVHVGAEVGVSEGKRSLVLLGLATTLLHCDWSIQSRDV